MGITQPRKIKISRTQKLGSIVVFVLVLTEIISALPTSPPEIDIRGFYASSHIADVGEPLNFTWDIYGATNSINIQINFGDGTIEEIYGADHRGKFEYVYSIEGKFNVTIYVTEPQKQGITHKAVDNLVEITNNPPDIPGLTLNWESENGPYEDEEVEIIVDINDSSVDLIEGKISYVYDFGDGNQIVSNKSTVIYNWTTRGNYPLTVTVIDDQGALDQYTQFIDIYNKDPEAFFTLGADVPATFTFKNDIIGNLPFKWEPTGNGGSSSCFRIRDEINSHGKVLEIIGNKYYSNEKHSIKTNVENLEFGTIEYQFMTTNTTSVLGLLGIQSELTEELSIFTDQGVWKYRLGGENGELMTIGNPIKPLNDTWHHVRLDFCIKDDNINKDDSCYGLKSYQFRVSIDGNDFIYHYLNRDSELISSLKIGSFREAFGKAYIDSIGLSWDENYKIGDNFDVYRPSFYGTYDWREDIIGKEPNDWEIYEDDIASDFVSSPLYFEDFDNLKTVYSVDQNAFLNWEVFKVPGGPPSETRTYLSPDNLNLNLDTNDKISISFRTSSIKEIYLSLRDSSGLIAGANYLILKEENLINEFRRIVITVKKPISASQLQIKGIFRQSDNFDINEIQITHNEIAQDLSKSWTLKGTDDNIMHITQNPTDDSNIQKDKADTNYGNSHELEVGWVEQSSPSYFPYHRSLDKAFYYLKNFENLPRHFAWDGQNFWIYGQQKRLLFKYDANWQYEDSYDSLGSYSGNFIPNDIFWDGENWWVLRGRNAYIFEEDWNNKKFVTSYASAFNLPGSQNPKGFLKDDEDWWVLQDQYVAQFSKNLTLYEYRWHFLGNEDSNPVKISWDGTYWYMLGGETDSVYIYEKNWVFTGDSYYIGDLTQYPGDMLWDGNNWYLLAEGKVFTFDSNWNFLGVTIDIDRAMDYVFDSSVYQPGRDLWFNGKRWTFLDRYKKSVYTFDRFWNFLKTEYIGNIVIEPCSLSWDGNYWWVLDRDYVSPEMSKKVYRYNNDWQYTNYYYRLNNMFNPISIFFESNFWWVADMQRLQIFKYSKNWNQISIFSLGNANFEYIMDISWDGKYWWIRDYNTKTYKYSADWKYSGLNYDLEIDSETAFFDGSKYWETFRPWDDTLHGPKISCYTSREMIRESFIKKDCPYLITNVTQNSDLDIYASLYKVPQYPGDDHLYFPVIKVSQSEEFFEGNINWNNRPNDKEFLSTTKITKSGWSSIDLGPIPYSSYKLEVIDKHLKPNGISIASSEVQKSRRPVINHHISKIHQGNNMLYIQTNETEEISLVSPDKLNVKLLKGDKIEIKFNTTSTHKISLDLFDVFNIKHSCEISPENNKNFDSQEITIYLEEDILLDRIEFRGLFEDTQNLIIGYIKIQEGIRSSISVIDEGGDFGKVVQFQDRSTNNELWMENFFDEQLEGTIECWIKTSDIIQNNWELTFWNNIEHILTLSVDATSWIYSSDGINFERISGIESPHTNQWYNIRISFSVALNLFTIKIDDSPVRILFNTNFDSVNKIRIGTKKDSKGVSWIDAIGYSWDDFYDLGDNYISLVVYPEKTNIQFSAADSTDSKSDLDSLRFYWEFGDGATAFGKYISHDYLTSGRYEVKLHCKDDNGEISIFSQTIEVYNQFPEINLTSQTDYIIAYEGDTLLLNAESWDEITDFTDLSYWWNFNSSELNKFDFIDSDSGGWRNAHIYTDDFKGKIGVMVNDSEGGYDYDFIDVFIKNVDPLMNVYDACMIANISLEVLRSSEDINGNFSFSLVGNENPIETQILEIAGDIALDFRAEMLREVMSLSKNWKVVVKNDKTIPDNTWLEYKLNLEYLDGKKTIISSGKYYGSTNGVWELNLDPYWLNMEDFTYKHPIMFFASLWDPSNDDLEVSSIYEIDMIVEINCTNILPLVEQVSITEQLGEVNYEVHVFEENETKFAHIKAFQQLPLFDFNNNKFPVNIDCNLTLFPIINLRKLLVDKLGLENFSLYKLVQRNNLLKFEVKDDDGGFNSMNVEFDSIFDIQNLSPHLETFVPYNSSTQKEIQFYVEVNDYDQLKTEVEFEFVSYSNDDVPDVLGDFLIINGTVVDGIGDLFFQDNDSLTFNSVHLQEINTLYLDDFNDNIRAVNWTDDSNFGIIKEEDGVLKLGAWWLSHWGSFCKWFLAWAPYCTIPLSMFSKNYWEVAVKVASPTTAPMNHHYGLILYENDTNVWMYGPYDSGNLTIIKIVDGEPYIYSQIESNDTYIRISKSGDTYSFDHSPDNSSWYTLTQCKDLEINATDTGIFHRAWFWSWPKWASFDNFSMRETKETQRELSITAKLNIEHLGNEYLLKYLRLYADYSCNISQIVNISIFNWKNEEWDLFDSHLITDKNYNLNISMLNFDYFDENNDLLIRFEAVNQSNSFKFSIDRLRLSYSFQTIIDYRTTNSVFSGSILPIHNDEYLNLYSGKLLSIGNFEQQDDDFSIFKSEQDINHSIGLVVRLWTKNLVDGDKMDSAMIDYSFRTNISQIMNLFIFNYTSNEWDLVKSAISDEFGNYSILIESDDYYQLNEVLLQFEAVNNSNAFEFHLDQLKMNYTYYPQYLLSNNTHTVMFKLQLDEEGYAVYNSGIDDLIFPVYLPQITENRILKQGQVEFTLKSDTDLNLFFELFNFSSNSWEISDNFIIESSSDRNYMFGFNQSEFISTNGLIKIRFTNTNQEIFNLNVKELKIDYEWSEIWGEYHSNLRQLEHLYDISGKESYKYSSSEAFQYQGDYLITHTVDDGFTLSRRSNLITVFEQNTYAKILNIPGNIYEDQQVELESEINNAGFFSDELRYEWSFGDGGYSYIKNPLHSWSKAGTYNISLLVVDCFGNEYIDILTINIKEKSPEIFGPFVFQGYQGQAVILDMEIFDSNYDEMTLEYEWYNVPANEVVSGSYFSNDKKPVVILDVGVYEYSLLVRDSSGYSNIADLTLIIDDIAPIVYVSNYMYYGNKKGGEANINLKASVYDSYLEGNNFIYSWTIHNGLDKNVHPTHYSKGLYDTLSFTCKNTTLYIGDILVTDSHGASSIASFMINSYIDSNGNLFSDEFEEQLRLSGKTLDDCPDTDDDGLIDAYEDILGYNKTVADMDGDGLLDGYNKTTGIGEATFGTNPRNDDTDGDLLPDYNEILGWNVTLNQPILVSSDPLMEDTDKDGLTDYQEFNLRTDPRNSDTDNDGLNDKVDPYPTKYDQDEDGLNDFEEFRIGTDLNSSDTDSDGLSDGQEVKGWDFITNPLTIDSDHDFLNDNEEIVTYNYKLDKRVDFSKPTILLFEEFCTKAANAKISIGISFGESDFAEGYGEYGISDIPNLNISIIKENDNLVVFQDLTNYSRYYSEVVDIKQIIEGNKKNYHGNYIIQINDTNSGCLLENFEIEIVKYLDPNMDDFDEDGIMDGVEVNLLLRGNKKIDFHDKYYYDLIHFPVYELAWWTFEEGNGKIANDYGYFEMDGFLNNMDSNNWVSGKVGEKALRFDGTEEYIIIDENDQLNFNSSDSFTFNFWFKTNSIKGGVILSRMNDLNRGFEIHYSEDGKIIFDLISQPNENQIKCSSTSPVNDNEWHMITVSYEGMSRASGVYIYIDGASDEIDILIDNLNDSIDVVANLTIASQKNQEFFNGELDDIRIFDYVLTTEEINWLNNTYKALEARSIEYLEKGQFSKPNIQSDYSIDIPHQGRVYDAKIIFKIQSIGIPDGQGKINISLYKREMDNNIPDFTIFSEELDFDYLMNFESYHSIELAPLINDNSIFQYYGEYFIAIDIQGSHSTDKFLVSLFEIELDTYRERYISEPTVWKTDPAKNDTDGDGWSDNYEIFQRDEPTNPLSKDTDGDGAIDSYDRDPIRDLIIEISPIYGWHKNLWYWESSPLLEIIISFWLREVLFEFKTDFLHRFGIYLPPIPIMLSGDRYSYTTQKQRATDDLQHLEVLWIHYYKNRKAYFDGSHGSTEQHYYTNIDDDIRLQSNTIDFTCELWHMGPKDIFGSDLWDTKVFSASKPYEIGTDSDLTLSRKGLFGFNNELKINVKTLSIEKANTIAVYNNDTLFHGHYQTKERMNIIQLYVNDETPLSNTPFELGPNVIVIPTSLFSETLLNSIIQNEKLEETVLYKEGFSEFISIDREGETSEACGDVDFVYVRFDISSEEAMIVLDMLINCIINESTGETAITYGYGSTKNDGFVAVLMNLPLDVLRYVPWINNYTDSEQGKTPRGFWEWLGDKVEEVVSFVVGIFVAIWEGIVQIWEAIVEFVAQVLMALIEFLADLLWLLVRAALLIYIYAMLAVSIFGLLITYGVLLVLSPVVLLMGGSISLGFLDIKYNLSGINFRMRSYVEWVYNDFFDFNYPVIVTELYLDDELIQQDVDDFLMGLIDTLTFGLLSNKIDSNENPNLEHNSPHLEDQTFDAIDFIHQEFLFSVVYWDDNGYAPETGYPVLEIYKDNNFYDQKVMKKSLGQENNYFSGVKYEVDFQFDGEGIYEYKIVVLNNHSEETSTNREMGPSNMDKLDGPHIVNSYSEEVDNKLQKFKFYSVYWDNDGYAPINNPNLIIYNETGHIIAEKRMVLSDNQPVDYYKGVHYESEFQFINKGEYHYRIEVFNSENEAAVATVYDLPYMQEDLIESIKILPVKCDVWTTIGIIDNWGFKGEKAQFSVKYTNPSGEPPLDNFLRLNVYRREDYNDPKRIRNMEIILEPKVTDTDYENGVIFTATRELKDIGDFTLEVEGFEGTETASLTVWVSINRLLDSLAYGPSIIFTTAAAYSSIMIGSAPFARAATFAKGILYASIVTFTVTSFESPDWESGFSLITAGLATFMCWQFFKQYQGLKGAKEIPEGNKIKLVDKDRLPYETKEKAKKTEKSKIWDNWGKISIGLTWLFKLLKGIPNIGSFGTLIRGITYSLTSLVSYYSFKFTSKLAITILGRTKAISSSQFNSFLNTGRNFAIVGGLLLILGCIKIFSPFFL